MCRVVAGVLCLAALELDPTAFVGFHGYTDVSEVFERKSQGYDLILTCCGS